MRGEQQNRVRTGHEQGEKPRQELFLPAGLAERVKLALQPLFDSRRFGRRCQILRDGEEDEGEVEVGRARCTSCDGRRLLEETQLRG